MSHDHHPSSRRKPGLLMARAVFPEALARLAQHFDVEPNPDDTEYGFAELSRRLAGKQALFSTAGEPLNAALFEAHPQLRAVCLMTVGYNNVDVAAATARGVLVTNAPGVLTETTADLGFGLMMATARRFSEAERFLRSGQWTKWRFDLLTGSDIHGATLGILGMGRIGQAIARRGALGFGMKVVYHNRSRLPAADELALMKPTATLTNVARGGIVDDAALAEALRARRIAAAGLDVFEREPSVHPALLELPNVVLLPHIGSATEATRRRMVDCAVDNLIAAVTGGVPPTPVNPEVLPLRPWAA